MIWGSEEKKELKAGACVLARSNEGRGGASCGVVLPRGEAEGGERQSPHSGMNNHSDKMSM